MLVYFFTSVSVTITLPAPAHPYFSNDYTCNVDIHDLNTRKVCNIQNMSVSYSLQYISETRTIYPVPYKSYFTALTSIYQRTTISYIELYNGVLSDI